jgi:hypothetical protein
MSMLDDVAARLRSLLTPKNQFPTGADLAGDDWQEMPRYLAAPALAPVTLPAPHPMPPPIPQEARQTVAREDDEWTALVAAAKSDGALPTLAPGPDVDPVTALPEPDEWASLLAAAKSDGDPRTNRPTAEPEEDWTAAIERAKRGDVAGIRQPPRRAALPQPIHAPQRPQPARRLPAADGLAQKIELAARKAPPAERPTSQSRRISRL